MILIQVSPDNTDTLMCKHTIIAAVLMLPVQRPAQNSSMEFVAYAGVLSLPVRPFVRTKINWFLTVS